MPPLHRGVLNGGASEHKTKRIVKDKYQLQEQLIYLGSGFIESYKCYTLSTSIREIHPVSHVPRAKATCHVQCGVGLLKNTYQSITVSLL